MATLTGQRVRQASADEVREALKVLAELQEQGKLEELLDMVKRLP